MWVGLVCTLGDQQLRHLKFRIAKFLICLDIITKRRALVGFLMVHVRHRWVRLHRLVDIVLRELVAIDPVLDSSRHIVHVGEPHARLSLVWRLGNNFRDKLPA